MSCVKGQVRGWEVQDQGAGKVGFILRPLFLACWHVGNLVLNLHDVPFVWVWRERPRMTSLVSLLIWTLILSDQGSALGPHLITLMTALEAPSPNTAILGVRASTYELRWA